MKRNSIIIMDKLRLIIKSLNFYLFFFLSAVKFISRAQYTCLNANIAMDVRSHSTETPLDCCVFIPV